MQLVRRDGQDARTRGARWLQGWFLPTKKNAPAENFYRDHGFMEATRNEEGTLFKLELTQNVIATPEWL